MLKTMALKKWKFAFERFKREKTVLVMIKAFALLFGIICIYLAISKFMLNAKEQEYYEISKSVSESVLTYTRVCDTIAASENVTSLANGMREGGNIGFYALQIQRELDAVTSVSSINRSQVAIFFSDTHLAITPTQYYINSNFDTLFSAWYGEGLTYDLIHSNASTIWSTYYANGRCWLVWNVMTGEAPTAHIILELDFRKMFSLPDNCMIFIGSDSECIYSNFSDTTDEQYAQLLNGIFDNRNFTLSGKKYHAIKNVFSNVELNIIVGVPVRTWESAALSIGLTAAFALILVFYKILKERNAAAQVKDSSDMPREDQGYLESLGLGQIIQVMLNDDSAQGTVLAKKCLEISGIDPKKGYFIVGITSVNDALGIFGSCNDEKEEYISPYFVLNNMLQDTLFVNRHGALGISNGYYIALAEQDEQEGTGEIDGIMSHLASLAEDYLGLSLAMTEAVLVHGLDMTAALRLVTNRISHKAFWMSSQKEPSDDNSSDKPDSFFVISRKFHDCLDDGNYDKAQEIFEQIIEKHLPLDCDHLDIVKYRLYAIFDMMVSITGYQSYDLGHSLAAINSIESFRTISKKIFTDLIEHQQASAGNPVNAIVPQVKEFTHENYMDNTLNVTSIAAHFELNVAYLSRIFKEGTGMNLLEYIHRTRVNAAKELIPFNAVKDVSDMVGFGDIQSFVRTFKKYEGVTPAEYKKIYSCNISQ